MAGATGLEPATSGVTGRHSNQLSYAPAGVAQGRPHAALELSEGPVQVKDLSGSRAQHSDRVSRRLVGGERLELPTSTV